MSKVYEDERRIAALFGGGYEKEPTIKLYYAFQAKREVKAAPSFKLSRVTLTEIAEDKNKSPKPKSEDIADAEALDDKRTWRWTREVPKDTLDVRVETTWTDEKGAQRSTDAMTLLASAPLNSKKPVPLLVGRDGPRLVVSLNEAPVEAAASPPSLDFGKPGAAELQHLFAHVWKRLEGGMDEVWRHAYLRAGLPLRDGKEVDLEEQWARLVTEAFVGLTYAVPSVIYTNLARGSSVKGQPNPKDQKDPKESFSDGAIFYPLQEGDDPTFPICTECQHSCTLAIITRGHKFPLDKKGYRFPHDPKDLVRPRLKDFSLLSAAANPGAFSTLTPKGTWAAIAHDAKESEAKDHVAPGSVYGFNSKEAGIQGKGSHVAFLVRVLSKGKDDKPARVQFLDTGGVFGESAASWPLLVKHAKGTNPPKVYDMYGSGLLPGSTRNENFGGIGKLGDDADQKLLAAGVDRLRRARPIGLVRFVVTRRSEDEKGDLDQTKYAADRRDEWLVYASPWLRMWGPGKEQSFFISRLVWALREHPGREQLKVRLLVDLPRGRLYRALVEGGRQKTARDLVKEGCPLGAPEMGFHYLPLITFGTRPDGAVLAEGFYRAHHIEGTKTTETPVGRPKAFDKMPPLEAILPSSIPASALDGLPKYFRDENP